MLKTNKDKVVMQSTTGLVHNPLIRGNAVRIDCNGVPFYMPSVGGICYNVKIGDSVYGLAGDHIEPGVSAQNPDTAENGAFNFLSCVGNEAVVMNGEAKGGKGYVTGTHGGIEHVIIWFPENVLNNLCPGDKILVKACGQGLALLDYPDVYVKNCDPKLFEKLGITEKDGKLVVPVAGVVPAHLMGSGIGHGSAHDGDYDIMTADYEEIVKNKLDNLKFGDIVMLSNCDNTFGRGYLTGAMSIGVIVHSDCKLSGHGPGVVTLLACKTNKFEAKIDATANIGKYLNII